MTGEKYYNYRPVCEETIKKYLNNADPSGELAELFNDLCKWRSQRDDVNAKRNTKDDDLVGRVLATENLNEAAEAFCHGYEEAISKTASTTLIPVQVRIRQFKDIAWRPKTYDPKHIKTVYQKYLSDEDWEVNRERGLKVGQGVKKAMKPRTLEEFEGFFKQWLNIVRIDKMEELDKNGRKGPYGD